MADISKITTLDGTTYNLKDATVPTWAKATTKPSYTAAEVGAKSTQSAVNSPTASGTTTSFIDTISQNTQGVISATKKTVSSATTSAAGLMSATDKSKLDGIANGAQVNSITGVKGNSESSYRTGNVNLTAANIGALSLTGGTITGSISLNPASGDAQVNSNTAIKVTTNNGISFGNPNTTLDQTYLSVAPGAVYMFANLGSSSGSSIRVEGDQVKIRSGISGSPNASIVLEIPQVLPDGVRATLDGSGFSVSGGAFRGNLTGNVTGNAATATKATQDGSGNVIAATYLQMFTAGGLASCNGGGQNWYFKVATITISGGYINRPIVFEVSGRGRELTLLQLIFQNINGTDPAVASFTTSNYNIQDFWIKKVATSKWEIFGKYSEQWGSYTIHRITGTGADIGVVVNMTNMGTSDPTSGAQRVVYNQYLAWDRVTGKPASYPGGCTGNAANVTGTVAVANGGTGATSLTSGAALIGNGTGAVTTRSITNNTSATAVTASTNLITANTLYYHKGNSNITTVGTITSGTWNGTAIAAAYIGNHSTDKLTSGTLPVGRGGTGATNAPDARTNLDVYSTGQVDEAIEQSTVKQIVTGGNNASTISVPSGTATACNTMTLTKGVWLVIGTIDWAANANGYRQAALASGTNPARHRAATTAGISGKEAYVQVSQIISTTGESISLYALQNSGAALNAYPYLYAVRIGNN